jgi:hypothetical protein
VVSEAAWQRRYSDPETLGYADVASEKRIELAPKLKAAVKRQGFCGPGD